MQWENIIKITTNPFLNNELVLSNRLLSSYHLNGSCPEAFSSLKRLRHKPNSTSSPWRPPSLWCKPCKGIL